MLHCPPEGASTGRLGRLSTAGLCSLGANFSGIDHQPCSRQLAGQLVSAQPSASIFTLSRLTPCHLIVSGVLSLGGSKEENGLILQVNKALLSK